MVNLYNNINNAAHATTSSLSKLDEQPCDPANIAMQELIGDITKKNRRSLESDFPPPTSEQRGGFLMAK